MDTLTNLIHQIWTVWYQMAPFLLLGFAVAGTLSIFVKPEFIQKHLGKGKFLPVIKTTLSGVPLPLCSCGVIPVAASLRKQGASRGATLAFLLSTPQTGVDSIAVTYSLMGGFFAIFRPLTALISGLVGGFIISFVDDEEDDSGKDVEIPMGCCGDDSHPVEEPGRKSLLAAVRYAFDILPKDIGKPLVFGVIIAGIITALAPPAAFEGLPGGNWTQMLFMMLLGIPVYVCATASIPVAAALILKGISPGAALVFLITGPATNAAAISTIWKIMGRWSALIYLAIVAVFALLSGVVADLLLTKTPSLYPTDIHIHGPHSWEIVSGILLVIILANAFWPRKSNISGTHSQVSTDSLTMSLP
ncbi:SO_0444 family Cu/Zn efflux transporter [bacterium]|nr:SO_0444 family Cu/Zn efflux transporter [bacterium]